MKTIKNRIINLAIAGVLLTDFLVVPLVQAQTLNFQSDLLASVSQLTNSPTQLLEEGNLNTTSTDNITVPPPLSLSEYTVVLLNTANELKQAPVAKKQTIAARLAEYARMRKNVVLQDMKDNPQAVINNTLPGTTVSQLPPDIQPLLEKEITIKGKFQTLHIDNSDGSSRYEFSIIDEATGKRYQLHFANDKFPSALTDDKVQIRGIKMDSEIALIGGSTNVTTLSASSPTILPNTFGPQKTLLILVNFTDKAIQPYTVTAAQNVMNTTSNFDLENSFNQTSLTGVVDTTAPADIAGWFTIPVSYTTCDISSIASYAEQAATTAGFNLSSYTHYVYAFPDNACAWWGLGTVGGNPSKAWVNGSFQLRVVGHEMGHNFGLSHSHSMSCDSNTCTTSEYGDGYDIMGGSSQHFNAFQKSRLGWLNYNTSPPVTLVSSNGTYTIAPYESNDIQPKALQILKSSGTTNTYYYVEYRAGLGFDSGTTAVVVHSASPSDANSSNLWDLDQITTTSDWILNIGQTYQDATAGVSITAISAGLAGANIGVTFGPVVVCVPSNPSLVFSTTSVSLFAGQSASFNYTLTNNDTSSCPSSNFSVTPSLPAGFTQSPSPINYTLLPGASVSGTLIISTPSSAGASSYSVTETAQNTSTSTVFKSVASLTINILPPPSSTLNDDFNRADSTILGSAWQEINGDLYISSNQVRNAATKATHAAVVPSLVGAIQDVSADFASLSSNGGPRFGVILRYQNPNNYYLAYRQTGGSSKLRISKIINGVETILASLSTSNPSLETFFRIAGTTSGSTLTLTLNGIQKLSVNDATFSTGSVGMLIGTTGNISLQKSHRADNFAAVVK